MIAAMVFALTLACAPSDETAQSGSAAGAANGVGSVATVANASTPTTVSASDTIQVWKDPNCGCCKNWVEHMRKHGYTVVVHDTPDLTPVKQTHGVGADLVACHTAVIAGYTIEGHVPADLVDKLLEEKPDIAGLAVPGMPMGSPGMEGGTPEHYDVIAFTSDGGRSVYASR
jgi:hypothetical protein